MEKRLFDILLALFVICVSALLLIAGYILASIDTLSHGVFVQERIGRFGKSFKIFKLKTIRNKSRKISAVGKFLRRSKADELPQLFNILLGSMSFVGPRPDISGYYDRLEGESRKILKLRPGLTSEASLKYYCEDDLLKKQANAQQYNDEVIFPDKVRMNLNYYYKQSFTLDLKIILNTLCRMLK